MSSNRRRNLFHIDPEAIVTTLADANAGLVSRIERSLAEIDHLAKQDPSVENATREGRRLKALEAEIRLAQASDNASFREAQAIVKTYFDNLRAKVASRLEKISQFLDAQLHMASVLTAQTVVANCDGVSVIEVQSASRPIHLDAEWAVDKIERKQLDLEALRDCFTDHQLMMACKRHLRETRQRSLAGVHYQQHARLNSG